MLRTLSNIFVIEWNYSLEGVFSLLLSTEARSLAFTDVGVLGNVNKASGGGEFHWGWNLGSVKIWNIMGTQQMLINTSFYCWDKVGLIWV